MLPCLRPSGPGMRCRARARVPNRVPPSLPLPAPLRLPQQQQQGRAAPRPPPAAANTMAAQEGRGSRWGGSSVQSSAPRRAECVGWFMPHPSHASFPHRLKVEARWRVGTGRGACSSPIHAHIRHQEPSLLARSTHPFVLFIVRNPHAPLSPQNPVGAHKEPVCQGPDPKRAHGRRSGKWRRAARLVEGTVEPARQYS